jgi:glycosyltransferase involved in cell wall biosynthesis
VNVGIVTATYTPSRNGVATSTALFVEGLRRLGHRVRVFAPDHPTAAPEEDVHRLPGLRSAATPDYPLLLPIGPLASRRLRLDDLDVLHTMHPFVAGYVAHAWARRLGVPLVFTAHTQYHAYVHYAPTPAGVTAWATKRHVAAFARAADVVLVPGEALVDVLRSYGYAGAIERMANPVDLGRGLDAPDPELRARFGVPGDAPLLLYVGRMAPEKGLTRLLDAVDAARRTEPRLHLMMVGDGPSRAALMARDEPHVRWVGAVDHREVAGFVRAADLFVSASATEVQPMTFLESLAGGTPVVAADSAAARELVGPGLTVCAPEAPALSAAILAALRAPDPAGRRRAARESIRDFDVDVRTAALADVYARAIARHPRRRRPPPIAARRAA